MARVNGKSPNGTVASRERREALRKYQIEQERKEKQELKFSSGSFMSDVCNEMSTVNNPPDISFTDSYLLRRIGGGFPELKESCDNMEREIFINSILTQLSKNAEQSSKNDK